MIFLRGLLRGVNAFWIFGVSFLRGFWGFLRFIPLGVLTDLVLSPSQNGRKTRPITFA